MTRRRGLHWMAAAVLGGIAVFGGLRLSAAPAAEKSPEESLSRLLTAVEAIDPKDPNAINEIKQNLHALVRVNVALARENAALRKQVAALETAGPAPVPTPASGDPTPTGPFFAKKGLTKYHRTGCRFGEAVKAQDRVYFAAAKDAEGAKLEACRVCRPDEAPKESKPKS